LSEQVKIDKNLSMKDRVTEFEGIQRLLTEFGEPAYAAIEKYYLCAGYEVGYDTILKMVSDGSLTRARVRKEPVQAVLSILTCFFADRGGNQPEFSMERDTIHLTTRGETYCPAPAAREKVGLAHCDICFVHKRPLAEGLARAICEFVPGLKIQVWNVESRNRDGEVDCTEAFKVIPAWKSMGLSGEDRFGKTGRSS
jgi:hypothetical protein